MRGRKCCVVLVCLVVCGCGKKQKTTAELIEDLKGTNEADRLIAVRLLPQHKDEAAQSVPALIDALKDKAGDIRLSAAIGLGAFGEQAKDAIPALQAARRDHDARIREAAGHAMTRIDPGVAPQAVPKSPGKR